MDDKERDHYDRLIAEQRDRRDRQKALIDEASDAYKDYHDAKRDENVLGMWNAKKRIDEAKKQIEAMNSTLP